MALFKEKPVEQDVLELLVTLRRDKVAFKKAAEDYAKEVALLRDRMALLPADASDEAKMEILGMQIGGLRGRIEALLGTRKRRETALRNASKVLKVNHLFQRAPETILTAEEKFERAKERRETRDVYNRFSKLFILLRDDLCEAFGYDTNATKTFLRHLYKTINSTDINDATLNNIINAAGKEEMQAGHMEYFGMQNDTPWEEITIKLDTLVAEATKDATFNEIDVKFIEAKREAIVNHEKSGKTLPPKNSGTNDRAQYIQDHIVGKILPKPKFLESSSKTPEQQWAQIQADSNKLNNFLIELNSKKAKGRDIRVHQVVSLNYDKLKNICSTRGIDEAALIDALSKMT